MAEPLQWQDLSRLSRHERVAELLLPLPWLLLAAGLAAAGATLPAVVAVAPFFTAALRLTHDTYHRNLGLSRREGDLLLFALSLVLGGALHAIEYTHLRHHRDCLAEHDTEGRISHYGFWAALVRSPLYPLLIHREALRDGSARQRRWVRRELAAVALLQLLIWSSGNAALQTLSLTLLAANALVPMIGIWSVHRGCSPATSIARSSRRSWLQRLSFHMLYHAEHHAYPSVPARHLPRLAQRLDACTPRRAPEVLPTLHATRPAAPHPRATSRTRQRRAAAVVALAVVLIACTPGPAERSEIDVCPLVAATATAFIDAPLTLPEPSRGALAGGCRIRSIRADVSAQIEIHVYTTASAQRDGTDLQRLSRVLLAEARSTYGTEATAPTLRRARSTAWFGTGEQGQLLVEGRGIVLEIGLRGVAAQHVREIAEPIWQRVRRH